MPSSSVGVTGVAGLSVRGETGDAVVGLVGLVADVGGSPLTGSAGGSMVMAEEVQHRSLRRRRELKTVVVDAEGVVQCVICGIRGARAGRERASLWSVLCSLARD